MCCWDLSWRSLSAASLRQVSAIVRICSRCASLGALRASASHSAAFRRYSLTWRTAERLSTATRCWSRSLDLMIGAKRVGRAVQVCDSRPARPSLGVPGGRRSVRRRPRLRLARYGYGRVNRPRRASPNSAKRARRLPQGKQAATAPSTPRPTSGARRVETGLGAGQRWAAGDPRPRFEKRKRPPLCETTGSHPLHGGPLRGTLFLNWATRDDGIVPVAKLLSSRAFSRSGPFV